MRAITIIGVLFKLPEIFNSTIIYDPDCTKDSGCPNNDPDKFQYCPDCGKKNNFLRDTKTLKPGFDIPELTDPNCIKKSRIDYGNFNRFPVFTPDKLDVEILFAGSYIADSSNIYEPMKMGEPLEKHVRQREQLREELRSIGIWCENFDKTFDERFGVYTMFFHE